MEAVFKFSVPVNRVAIRGRLLLEARRLLEVLRYTLLLERYQISSDSPKINSGILVYYIIFSVLQVLFVSLFGTSALWKIENPRQRFFMDNHTIL